MSSISQGFGDVRQRAREAIAGMWFRDSSLNRYDNGLNESPQAKQVSTITVDSDPGDGTAITVTINSVDVETVVPASGTTATIAQAIADAIDAEPLVRGQVVPTVASNVVTLTAAWPGTSFTLAEDESFLSIATATAAAEADAIPFGAAIISQGFRSDGETEKLVALAAESQFTPQVQTFTVDTGAAVDIFVGIYEVRDGERVLLASDTVTGNGTAATQAGSIRTAINAIAPANTVIASGSSDEIICTAEIAGLEFDVVIAEAGVSKVLTTGPSPSTSLHRAFAGVSYYAENEAAATIGGTEGEYGANQGVTFARTGEMWVSCTDTVAEGDTVYVELGSSNTGLFFGSSGADRVALSRSRAQWLRNSRDSGDNLAGLRLS